MDKLIKSYKRAQIQRKISLAVMFLLLAAMIVLFCLGTMVFRSKMTQFIIAAVVAGIVGVWIFSKAKNRFRSITYELCLALKKSSMPVEEISALGRELKIKRNTLKFFVDGV